MAKRPTHGRLVSPSGVRTLISGALDGLQAAVTADRDKFFRNGIELIEVGINGFGISITLKVAGPKPPGLAAPGSAEPPGTA